uniref:Mannan endo-1,4-beta-mannosidase n=1 Tax=Opuntia streptacantha TaxID=393608 RepID=A0A7C9AG15_OPUST
MVLRFNLLHLVRIVRLIAVKLGRLVYVLRHRAKETQGRRRVTHFRRRCGGGCAVAQIWVVTPYRLYVNGWDSYWLMEAGVWDRSRSKVSKMFNKAAQMGLAVCRTWAFSDPPGPNSLQISPGLFDHSIHDK